MWSIGAVAGRSRARALPPAVQHPHQPLELARPLRGVGEPGGLGLAPAPLDQDRLAHAELAHALRAPVTGPDAALLHATKRQTGDAGRHEALVDARVPALEALGQRDAALHVAGPHAGVQP